MQDITKKEALEECYKLWSWLEKHPSKSKKDWPGWEDHYKTYTKQADLYCSCCDYDDLIDVPSCEACPLISLWPHLNKPTEGSCIYSTSPYKKWDKSKSPKTKKKYAGIIANECARLLAIKENI